jgi:hypothetical protein
MMGRDTVVSTCSTASRQGLEDRLRQDVRVLLGGSPARLPRYTDEER